MFAETVVSVRLCERFGYPTEQLACNGIVALALLQEKEKPFVQNGKFLTAISFFSSVHKRNDGSALELAEPFKAYTNNYSQFQRQYYYIFRSNERALHNTIQIAHELLSYLLLS